MGLRTKLVNIGVILGLEAIMAACGGRPEATPMQIAAGTPTPPPVAAQPVYPLTVELKNPQLNITDVLVELSDGSQKYFRLGRNGGGSKLVYGPPQGLELKGFTILNQACPSAPEAGQVTVRLSSNYGSTTYSNQAGISYLERTSFLLNVLPERGNTSIVVIPQLNLTNCE